MYDGDCNLCNRSVRFVRAHDRGGRFSPVPFQSDEGRALAASLGVDPETPHSVILLEEGRAYERSVAGIRILKELRGTRHLAQVLGIWPKWLLDRMYDLVARHREKVFGRAGQNGDSGPA